MVYMAMLKSKIMHSNAILNTMSEMDIVVGSYKINILCPYKCNSFTRQVEEIEIQLIFKLHRVGGDLLNQAS